MKLVIVCLSYASAGLRNQKSFLKELLPRFYSISLEDCSTDQLISERFQLILKGNHDLSIVGAINVCCNFHPAGMHDGIGVSLLFIHSSPESGTVKF